MAEYKPNKRKLIESGDEQNPQELLDVQLFQLSEQITDETTRCRLGLNLGLKHHEIKVSRTDNRDEFTIATFEMLQKWYQRQPDRHTAWLELTKALRQAGLELCIKEVFKGRIVTGIQNSSSPTDDEEILMKLDEMHKDIRRSHQKLEKLELNQWKLEKLVQTQSHGRFKVWMSSSDCTDEIMMPSELCDHHIVSLSERITDSVTLTKLGTALGLQSHEIRSSATDNPGQIRAATLEMLHKWFRVNNDAFTAYKELVLALRNAQLTLYISEVFK